MKGLLAAIVLAASLAAAWPAAGGATNECNGIQACIRVPGPWVVVSPGATAEYLLACPNGRGVVAGLDAQATTRDVRVLFDGRIGAPVSPGVTTDRSALFRAIVVGGRRQAFQPLLGCIRAGGGGRSTVSARVVSAGAALDLRARTVALRPGLQRAVSVLCPAGERLAGSWSALAFRTVRPPALAEADAVRLARVAAARGATVTAAATDALSPDAHALVQVGVECAP